MTKVEIEEKIKKIIAKEIRIDFQTITSNAHLQKDLFADSLDILSIRIKIEEAFEIMFTNEELQNLLKLDEIVELVERKIL